MTGRDLIVYILENGLEDEPIVKDGAIIGFMSVSQAAVKWDVGEATVETWAKIGWIAHMIFEGKILIPITAMRPQLEPRKDEH